MKNNARHIQNNRGFTLIEALIGFFILSIGMLGIASLQALSLKAGKTSVYSSVAVMKVEELFESMRSNLSADATVLPVYAVAGGLDNDCETVACTPLQIAQADVYAWEQNLKAGLPGDALTNVTVVPGAAPSKMATVTITITWNERKQSAAGSETRTYSATSYICTTEPC